MKVREVIERLELMGDDIDVTLFVHDGPVKRGLVPSGFWFSLPVDSVEWDAETRSAQIIGEA